MPLHLLAATAYDRTICSWLLPDKKRHTLRDGSKVHDGYTIYCIAFSPDTTKVVSCSSNGKVCISPGTRDQSDGDGDDDTLTAAASLPSAYDVKFFPCGHKIGVACHHGLMHVLDADTGKELSAVEVDTGMFSTLAVSPDGRFVAVCCADTFLSVVDLTDTEQESESAPARCLLDHPCWPKCAAFLEDGTNIVTCGDEVLRVWNWRLKRQTHALCGHTRDVHAVMVRHNLIASSSVDTTVRIWSAVNFRALSSILVNRPVGTPVFSCSGCELAAQCEDNIVVWDLPSGGDQIAVLRGHVEDSWHIAFPPPPAEEES